MNIHKFLFPSKHKDIEEYLTIIKDSKKELEEIGEMLVDNGIHLKNEVFMPEDILFKVHSHESEKGGITHIFSRNGFSMNQDMKELHTWNILPPDGTMVKVKINNLYEGIEFLRILGCDVNFETVMNRTETIDKIESLVGNGKV